MMFALAGCGGARRALLVCKRSLPESPPGSLLPFARRMSVATASSAVGFAVPQANVAIAPPRTLTDVWVAGRQVALVYQHNEVTVLISPASHTDPTANFETFIRDPQMLATHVIARLGQIGRNVALIISPHTDACRSNPAWVEFDDRGIDINIYSDTRSTAALFAVARSIPATD
jgi:hypothetical protein